MRVRSGELSAHSEDEEDIARVKLAKLIVLEHSTEKVLGAKVNPEVVELCTTTRVIMHLQARDRQPERFVCIAQSLG
jgi:hypothetical protein